MTTFLTIIAGVFVFCLSQYFLKLILEPIVEFRKILSDISHILLLNQREILSGKTREDLHESIAKLSAKLRSCTHLIPFHHFLYKAKIFGLPKKENILLGCRKLNILSYGVLNGIDDASEKAKRNEKTLKEISQLLSIETTFMMNNE
jgi:hypothetical protein